MSRYSQWSIPNNINILWARSFRLVTSINKKTKANKIRKIIIIWFVQCQSKLAMIIIIIRFIISTIGPTRKIYKMCLHIGSFSAMQWCAYCEGQGLTELQASTGLNPNSWGYPIMSCFAVICSLWRSRSNWTPGL